MANPRFGVGFRKQHFEELLAAPHAIDWLEILSDNHLGVGGARRAMLARVCGKRRSRCTGLAGVGDRTTRPGLPAQLRALADPDRPVFVIDHLFWTGLRRIESHVLLPAA